MSLGGLHPAVLICIVDFDCVLISSDRALRLILKTSVARLSFSCGDSWGFWSSRISATAFVLVVLPFVGFVGFVVLVTAETFLVVFTPSLGASIVLRGSLGGSRSHSRDVTVAVEQEAVEETAFLTEVARALAEFSVIAMALGIEDYYSSR
jgi:hypothetical protein